MGLVEALLHGGLSPAIGLSVIGVLYPPGPCFHGTCPGTIGSKIS